MSERDPYSWSNRSLLVNASASDMQTDEERRLLSEYHRIFHEIQRDEKRLHEISGWLRDDSDGAGKTNLVSVTEALAHQIDVNDRKLIDLESTALKEVLEREKKKAIERDEQRSKEALYAYKREQAKQTEEELRQRYRSRLEENRKKQEPLQVSKASVEKALNTQDKNQKKTQAKQRTFGKAMARVKEIVSNHSYIGCLLPLIIGALAPIVLMFIGIWNACGGDVGFFIINIVALPFAIIGAFNVFRGFCAIVEKDEENLGFNKSWHFVVYLLITIAGYCAVAFACAQWINL